jgi:hypothetical protein
MSTQPFPPAECPNPEVHGNPFRYCPSCTWIEETEAGIKADLCIAPGPKVSQPATIGRIVHYKLATHDAAVINQKTRTGNEARTGDVYPALIVRVWGGSGANLQVFLDGADTYWATSRTEGDAEGQWSWPPRV